MDIIIQGFVAALSPFNLILMIIGSAAGILFGALPGISSAMGAVLLLTFTYGMEPVSAIILLVAGFCGATYGGSITSILFGTPGTPANVMTVVDGYPMQKKGRGGEALGLAITASVLGGLFSTFVLILTVQPMSRVAISFGPAEYVALALLGLSSISSLGGKSQMKSFVSVAIGLLLATFGTDVISGVPRFTFGTTLFANGVHFIPVMIGAFAISEVFNQIATRDKSSVNESVEVNIKLMSWKQVWKHRWLMLKSAVIGVFIGILPGSGGSIASVIAYGEAVRSSKNPDEFGNGAEEGVIAPEVANNAATGGALVPTMALGIPGSGTTAILLGAFILHGMRPGPLLFMTQPTLLYGVFIAMFIANIFLFVGGRYGIRLFLQVSKLPYSIQGPVILLLCFIGSFALSNDMGNVWFMLFAGIVGYFLKKYGFSVAALVLGLVLGPLLEENLRRALIISQDNVAELLFRPIAGPIFLMALLAVLTPYIRDYMNRRKQVKFEGES